MIRSAKIRSMIARLGLVAILLVAIAPTVSRLLAPPSEPTAATTHAVDHHDHGNAGGNTVAGHAGVPCLHDHATDPGCTGKCGYCDLLSHSPSVAVFHYFAALAANDGEHRATLLTIRPAGDVFLLAAQPRGPPRPC